MVQAARAEAGGILAEAQKRALELRSVARQEAQKESGEILAREMAKAIQEKETRLAAAARDIERRIVLDDSARQKVVAAVVKCVCGSTSDKGWP